MTRSRARERTPLIGRAVELQQLGGALEEARLVTLHGAPGVGKTRVALLDPSVRIEIERR